MPASHEYFDNQRKRPTGHLAVTVLAKPRSVVLQPRVVNQAPHVDLQTGGGRSGEQTKCVWKGRASNPASLCCASKTAYHERCSNDRSRESSLRDVFSANRLTPNWFGCILSLVICSACALFLSTETRSQLMKNAMDSTIYSDVPALDRLQRITAVILFVLVANPISRFLWDVAVFVTIAVISLGNCAW